MGEIVDNQIEETQEERSNRQYNEAKESVLSTSKGTVKEGKEGVSMASETPVVEMGNTPMTVRPANITNQPAQPLMEKSTSTTITRQRKPATTGKSIDAQTIVKKLTIQAAMVMWVDSVQIPEILESASTDKDAREVMISYQKAIEQAKNTAIQQIQAL